MYLAMRSISFCRSSASSDPIHFRPLSLQSVGRWHTESEWAQREKKWIHRDRPSHFLTLHEITGVTMVGAVSSSLPQVPYTAVFLVPRFFTKQYAT